MDRQRQVAEQIADALIEHAPEWAGDQDDAASLREHLVTTVLGVLRRLGYAATVNQEIGYVGGGCEVTGIKIGNLGGGR